MPQELGKELTPKQVAAIKWQDALGRQHPEVLKYFRDWYRNQRETNPEKVRASERARSRKHRNKDIEASRRGERERGRRYRDRNREKVRALARAAYHRRKAQSGNA